VPVYNAKAVTMQTGVTPATLRAWERRYGILLPDRTSGGHRLYSTRDIAAIKWLKQQIEQGLSISHASALLQRMLVADEVSQLASATSPMSAVVRSIEAIRSDLHAALIGYDEVTADKVLSEAYALYSIETVCMDVIEVIFQQLGDDWAAGHIQVATEHFATHYLRRKLLALVETGTTTRTGTIVAGCAPTDLHEGGVLLLSIFLRRRGWRVVFLGQSVPLEDLPKALSDLKADVLVLSSTLIDSARELSGIQTILESIEPAYRPLFAFGGLAFIDHPELREQMTGVYLGETIQSGVELIERLMSERKKQIA
jgi:DNA-binding transcriptional MerR regulator